MLAYGSASKKEKKEEKEQKEEKEGWGRFPMVPAFPSILAGDSLVGPCTDYRGIDFGRSFFSLRTYREAQPGREVADEFIGSLAMSRW